LEDEILLWPIIGLADAPGSCRFTLAGGPKRNSIMKKLFEE